MTRNGVHNSWFTKPMNNSQADYPSLDMKTCSPLPVLIPVGYEVRKIMPIEPNALRTYKLYTLTLKGHIKTAEQRTITQQYGDWYTGRWWDDCYIWYSDEGTGRGRSPPSPLLAVPNVTVIPSTASVSTSYYSIWYYNYLWTLKGYLAACSSTAVRIYTAAAIVQS